MANIIKGFLYLFLGFIVFTSILSKYFISQPKVSTYTIKEKVNYEDKFFNWMYGVKEDKRWHGIIQATDDIGRTCTAFIITDTAALTAGHCMRVTKEGLKGIIKKNLPLSKKLEKSLLDRIIYLETNCPPSDIKCEMELKYLEGKLEKELAIRQRVLDKKPDTYSIMDVNGEDTKVTAVAYSKGTRRDYGWLEGDFKDFKKISLKPGWNVKVGDTLRACGFFGGKLPPTCVDFIASGNHNFDYAGEGIMVPGLSGGPVMDHLGYAVGIASRVSETFVIIVPTIGLIDIYTSEQAKKLRDKDANK